MDEEKKLIYRDRRREWCAKIGLKDVNMDLETERHVCSAHFHLMLITFLLFLVNLGRNIYTGTPLLENGGPRPPYLFPIYLDLYF